LLVLFTGQQDVKQPTECIVGSVYWLECEAANRLVGSVYWSAGCETTNRMYC